MFFDVLEMIFDNFSGVISALDVELFDMGDISITFWELLIAFLTISIIFAFFLRSSVGSGLAGIGNLVYYGNTQASRQAQQELAVNQANQRQAQANLRQAQRHAEANYKNSYEYYSSRRSRNEAYSKRYRDEHRKRG